MNFELIDGWTTTVWLYQQQNSTANKKNTAYIHILIRNTNFASINLAV